MTVLACLPTLNVLVGIIVALVLGALIHASVPS